MFAQNGGKIRKPRANAEPGEAHKFNEDVYKATTDILQGLNKGISYGDGTPGNVSETQNIDGWHSGPVVTPAVANTQFTVNHGLGRLPIGYHLIFGDQNGFLWAANTGAWSATQVFFKFTAGVTTIKVFLF